MRKLLILLALVPCLLLTACKAEFDALDEFFEKKEGRLIGTTFDKIQEEFGPLAMVCVEPNKTYLYLFEKTTCGFYFDNIEPANTWLNKEYQESGIVPANIALRNISNTAICTGLNGRIKEFSSIDTKMLSKYTSLLNPTQNVETQEFFYELHWDRYEIAICCDTDGKSISEDSTVRIVCPELKMDKTEVGSDTTAKVMQNPTPAPSNTPAPTNTPVPTDTPTPAPTAIPETFQFAGQTIKTGERKIEIAGDEKNMIYISEDEIDALIVLCPDLVYLDLDFCSMGDYSRIGELTKLEWLGLMSCGTSSGGNKITDISWVSSLNRLTYLNFVHNDIRDLKPIKNLSRLEELNLGDNPNLINADLEYISGLTGLKKLYLYQLPNLTDVSALSSLKNLIFLNFRRCGNLRSVKSLTGLSKLQELYLERTGINDLSYFSKFKSLKTLGIAYCPLEYADYFDLMSCTSLKKITLAKDDYDGREAATEMIEWYGAGFKVDNY